MTRRQFELFSWNVRGIGSYEKRRKVFNWIVKHSSQNSVIFLQETHSMKQVENNWRKMWRGNFFFSHGDNRSRGVLIGVRDGLEFKINKEIKDQNGRILILDVDIQEEPYILIMQIMTRLARLKLSLSCATSWKKSNLRRIQKLFGGEILI